MCINHTCKTDTAWRRAIALGFTANSNTALRRMANAAIFDRNVVSIIAGYVEPRKLRLESYADLTDALVAGDYIFIFTCRDELKKYSLLTGKMLVRIFRQYGMMCTDGKVLYICDGFYIFAYDMNLRLISQLDASSVALSSLYMYYVGCIVFVDPDGITKFDPQTSQTKTINAGNVGYFGNGSALYLIANNGDVTRYDGNSTHKVDIDRASPWNKAYGNNHIICAWLPWPPGMYRISCSSDRKNVCGSITINGYTPHRMIIGGKRIIVVIDDSTFIFDNPFPVAW